MSVYKKENPLFLRESIQSMLEQTKKPDEFILVEDGPLSEELYGVIDYFKNKYNKLFHIIKLEKNVGLGLALSIGVKKAKYNYIARMDSDDISINTRIEKEINEFIKDDTLTLVGSNADEFVGEINNIVSHVVLPEGHDEILKFNKRRAPFRHPSIIFKKQDILNVGNYRNYNPFEDYDLYNRILCKGYKCKNIQEPLIYVRTSPDFYKRRSGIKYGAIMAKFRWEQYRMGMTNFFEFVIYTTGHFIKVIYKRLLRK